MSCTQCHDPHTQQLRKPEGDDQCADCHADKLGDEHKLPIHNALKVECRTCHLPYTKTAYGRGHRYDGRSHTFRAPTSVDSLAVYDELAPWTVPGADQQDDLTEQQQAYISQWNVIQERGGATGDCYDNWKYPANMTSCAEFDIMPNACNNCHKSEFPTLGIFNDEERNKLLKGVERFERFKTLSTK